MNWYIRYRQLMLTFQTQTFPYARHSSYPELCYLVSAFRPRSVYPCVVEFENKSSNRVPVGVGSYLKNRNTSDVRAKFKSNTKNISTNERICRESESERRPKGKLRMRSLFGQYCTSDASFVDDYRNDKGDIYGCNGNSNSDYDDKDANTISYEKMEEAEEQEEMTMTTIFSEHEEETHKEHESVEDLYADCNTQLHQSSSEIQSGKVEAGPNYSSKEIETTATEDKGVKKRVRAVERSCKDCGRAEEFVDSEASKARTPISSPLLPSSIPSSRTVQPPVPLSNSQAHAQTATKKNQKDKHKKIKIHKRKDPPPSSSSSSSSSALRISQTRRAAYEAAMCTVKDRGSCAGDDEYNDWSRFGGLVCAGNNHAEMEIEL